MSLVRKLLPPLVSGTLALAIAARSTLDADGVVHQDLTPKDLRALVQRTARDFPSTGAPAGTQSFTLVADDPATYYLKEHYVGYPCVLVRLSRVRPDALRDLVVGAHRYVSAAARRKSPAHGAKARGRSTR